MNEGCETDSIFFYMQAQTFIAKKYHPNAGLQARKNVSQLTLNFLAETGSKTEHFDFGDRVNVKMLKATKGPPYVNQMHWKACKQGGLCCCWGNGWCLFGDRT